MHFGAILLTPPPHPTPAISEWNMTTWETIYTCAEDYLEEAFSKIPVQKNGS